MFSQQCLKSWKVFWELRPQKLNAFAQMIEKGICFNCLKPQNSSKYAKQNKYDGLRSFHDFKSGSRNSGGCFSFLWVLAFEHYVLKISLGNLPLKHLVYQNLKNIRSWKWKNCPQRGPSWLGSLLVLIQLFGLWSRVETSIHLAINNVIQLHCGDFDKEKFDSYIDQ